jgi:urease accessory protein
MRTAIEWKRAGDWPAGEATATVTLSYAERARRRIQLSDDAGVEFLLNLPRAVRLSEGDGLRLEQGGYIRVVAAIETLVEAKAADAAALARLAWHVGNRHVPAEIVDGLRLRIALDTVLEQMLRQLGAEVARVEAPFAPEGGAYETVATVVGSGVHGHHGHHAH